MTSYFNPRGLTGGPARPMTRPLVNATAQPATAQPQTQTQGWNPSGRSFAYNRAAQAPATPATPAGQATAAPATPAAPPASPTQAPAAAPKPPTVYHQRSGLPAWISKYDAPAPAQQAQAAPGILDSIAQPSGPGFGYTGNNTMQANFGMWPGPWGAPNGNTGFTGIGLPQQQGTMQANYGMGQGNQMGGFDPQMIQGLLSNYFGGGY